MPVITLDTEVEFARIVNELSRRRLLAGGLGAAALLGLAACGSTGDGPATTSETPPSRRVETAKGPVDVPANPTRVVSIQPSATATLYDLGVEPVGVYDQGAQYISPRYASQWNAAPKIGNAGEVQIEKVAALKPDLIIGADYPWNTKAYDKLSAIAPTVIIPVTSWQASAKTTAEAVNKLDALDALDKRVAARNEAIKTKHADILGRYRWNILQGGFDNGQFWVYGLESEVGKILSAAGVQFATASKETSGGATARCPTSRSTSSPTPT
ncbi:ABC transporter substrate-binding protein [Dactylosporangium sp. NPDC000555]|uniref:ABC transporter substrate-binding protein n=1 Tax=Dactylosporangium sp. NPDC000555 TaxID=3154260 RepID=UPI00331ECE44